MFIEILFWLDGNSSIKPEIIHNDLSSSAVINIDNNKKLARLTIWNDESCVLEAINPDTGEYIINERHEIRNINDFKITFKKFNDLLI